MLLLGDHHVCKTTHHGCRIDWTPAFAVACVSSNLFSLEKAVYTSRAGILMTLAVSTQWSCARARSCPKEPRQKNPGCQTTRTLARSHMRGWWAKIRQAERRCSSTGVMLRRGAAAAASLRRACLSSSSLLPAVASALPPLNGSCTTHSVAAQPRVLCAISRGFSAGTPPSPGDDKDAERSPGPTPSTSGKGETSVPVVSSVCLLDDS